MCCVLQWLWMVLVFHRYFHNPLSQYIDLLFLSNISAVILDDRFSGYYLHGRNQLQHSGRCNFRGRLLCMLLLMPILCGCGAVQKPACSVYKRPCAAVFACTKS